MAKYDARFMELGIRNLAGLVANFYAADALVQPAIRAAVQRGAEETAALASFLAPYDTGFMSEHVRIDYTASGLGFEVGWHAEDFFEAGLAFYPYFQEFGTSKMHAQPCLGPAWDDVRPRFRDDVGAAVQDAMARAMSGGD